MTVVAKFFRIKTLFLFLPNFSLTLEIPNLLQYKKNTWETQFMLILFTYFFIFINELVRDSVS